MDLTVEIIEMPNTPPKKLSSIKQVASFLAQRVGEGNRFTMLAVREAIPSVTQIDRRVRDLRDYGWVIRAYKDHPDLKPEEYLLEKIGERIWEQAPARRSDRVSGAARRLVFERDGHRCVVCGIGPGEEYPDLPGSSARLTAGHVTPKERGGTDLPDNLRTECARCNEEARHKTSAIQDIAVVWSRIKDLPRKDRAVLAKWISAGKREWSDVETLWLLYRQLPAVQRVEIERSLLNTLERS